MNCASVCSVKLSREEKGYKFVYFLFTGPYVLGVGVVTTLLSKEIWVAQHSMIEVFSFVLAIYWLNRKFGKSMAAYFDKNVSVSISSFFKEFAKSVNCCLR